MNDPRTLKVRPSSSAGNFEDIAPGPGQTRLEAGSYRDRNGAVFYRDGRVFRYLSEHALRNWEQLKTQAFFHELKQQGKVVDTSLINPDLHRIALDGWAGVLEHARIPFVSYPYEWPFGMLKDAALLHLELMEQALAADMILKDASAYNIQWDGARPVFIDIPSFEPLKKGEPWIGYRQFCELFLYPLMMMAYKGIDFRPWLRGRIDGIPAEEMQRLISTRDLVRPGVLLHVLAQNALQKRYASGGNVRGALAQAGFAKELIERNVGKLAQLVRKLQPKRTKTAWYDYERTHSYDEMEHARKMAFVRAAAAFRHWRLAWDLGCNTGAFSRAISAHCDYVVSVDGDWMAVEQLYLREKARGGGNILPLVVNLADASPNQGWRGAERKGLAERGHPELTLCLALVHHIVISANIPLADFIRWLAELETAIVIEFVGREDEMVQTLLANREDQYSDYHPEIFSKLLSTFFDVQADTPLKGGKRHLYFATPKEHGAQKTAAP